MPVTWIKSSEGIYGFAFAKSNAETMNTKYNVESSRDIYNFAIFISSFEEQRMSWLNFKHTGIARHNRAVQWRQRFIAVGDMT